MANDIVYIGYYCEQSYFTHLIENDKRKYSQARQNLEYSLLKGLEECGKIDVVSYAPYSPTLSCCTEFDLGSLTVHNICVRDNIIGIIKGARYFYSLISKMDNGSKLLMYAVNPMFVVPALLLKRRKRFEITTICSELPQYRRWKEKIHNRVKHKIQAMLNTRFDKYILLTKKMKDVIPIVNKPYMVMEGIYNGEYGEAKTMPNLKSIMYAGGLSEDNGIKEIVEGFKNSKADELWICGGGPLENYVREQAQNDGRIKYYGMMPVEEVRKLEKKAYLLVCMRDSSNPLTFYSFPSKVLEYLASGTRVAVSMLDGIPDEYYEYVDVIKNYDALSLKECIDVAIAISKEEYLELSKRQITFVRSEKCSLSQGKRVFDFVMR